MWIDVQIWAKANTPEDSIYIIPPYINGFRVYSERSILGCWKDGIISYYNETFAGIWWERMQDLGYTQKNYKMYNRTIYDSLDFQWLGKKYNASYIVAEQPGIDSVLPRVYENGHYVVFSI